MTEVLETFFKPETRKSGADIFAKDVVSIASGSDTQIQAYVRGSTSFRVSFSSPDISSSEFTANCTCTTAQKEQLCKHMWATLLKVEQKYPDFLESKTSIEKVSSARAGAEAAAGNARPGFVKPPPNEAFKARAEEMKAKQADYRKAQYQKQKERLKEQKTGKKPTKAFGSAVKAYPAEVETAFAYFSENGFEFKGALNEEDLSNARKKLSRIFHPDKGGSHDEALTLNEHFATLEDYLHSES